jgi:hypothetical protein
MSAVTTPQLILRLGSHAEKAYVEKMHRFLNGLIIGANLLEATPGATSSLIVKLCGQKQPAIPYFIDPMTYAFGEYVDRDDKLRSDLDWIKSDQKVDGVKVRDFKRSYRRLVDELGSPFSEAIQRKRALSASDFDDDSALDAMCKSILEYQKSRIQRELEKDEETRDLATTVPSPAGLFTPYFYLEPERLESLVPLTLRIAEASVDAQPGLPLYSVVCADISAIEDNSLRANLFAPLAETGVDGVWLWFSRFYEDYANETLLKAFRELVEDLAEHGLVFNMHGGFFSLALSKFGLSGISHGVGYGEQKDVIPVIGQSTPTVRYYLPPVHRRLGVPQIERAFDALGITTADDFFREVCDCVICRGVIENDLKNFKAFGDQHYSTPKSKRLAQTPAAAKRCRFHFLLCRIKERDGMGAATIGEINGALTEAADTWGDQPSLKSECPHLTRWVNSLSANEGRGR